jgi:hypothetical protein
MLYVVILCLFMAYLVHRERVRRVKKDLLDQAIAVQGAYAAYQNAALAHDNARFNASVYLEKTGKRGVKSVSAELSKDEDPEDRALQALKIANIKALENEWAMKATWEQEQAKLWRQLQELQSIW